MDDPNKFMDMIRTVDFPVRREKAAVYEWKTRFPKASNVVLSEDV